MTTAEGAICEKKVLAVIHGKPFRRPVEERPTELLEHLYIGNYKDAADLPRLKAVGITHVVNCAAFRQKDDSPYAQDTGVIRYKQFHADDNENYDMLQHFQEARDVIDDAKRNGGKALVHCAMGINRCAVICAAYIMADQELDVIQAVTLLKQKRGIVLFNTGFQRQLVKFARERGYLPEKAGQ